MDLLKSKKFLVSLAGVLVVVLNHYLGLPEESLEKIFSLLIAYVIGQGLADVGKEAKKLEK